MTGNTLKKLIKLADAHQAADEYRSGHYDWSGGGACSIGCTIRDAKKIGLIDKAVGDGDHSALAKVNGVPEVAWRLCDSVFEGVDQSDRSAWTPKFLRAIRDDADYSTLSDRISIRLLAKLEEDAIHDDVRASCAVTRKLYERRAFGENVSKTDCDATWRQAYAAWRQANAARSQADAACSQAYAACSQAYAACSQADAAWSQADAARRQANAACSQADAAWSQAYAARRQANAACSQANAARRQFWKWVGDMLCEELAREPGIEMGGGR